MNKVLFYSLIFVPLLGIIALMEHSPNLGVSILLLYALIYHPTISGIRLISMGKIEKGDFWKNYIPFWNKKYFRNLFLG